MARFSNGQLVMIKKISIFGLNTLLYSRIKILNLN